MRWPKESWPNNKQKKGKGNVVQEGLEDTILSLSWKDRGLYRGEGVSTGEQKKIERQPN